MLLVKTKLRQIAWQCWVFVRYIRHNAITFLRNFYFISHRLKGFFLVIFAIAHNFEMFDFFLIKWKLENEVDKTGLFAQKFGEIFACEIYFTRGQLN